MLFNFGNATCVTKTLSMSHILGRLKLTYNVMTKTETWLQKFLAWLHYFITINQTLTDTQECMVYILGLVLWHINPCRLFNAKSSLYIYIKNLRFGLVRFNSISVIVGYLMPNPFLYIYIKYMISKHIFYINQSFVYTQLNDQTVQFQTVQFIINTQFKWQTVLFDP